MLTRRELSFWAEKAKAKGAAADVRKGKSWQKIVSGKAKNKQRCRRKCMKLQNPGAASPVFFLLSSDQHFKENRDSLAVDLRV